MNVNKVTHADKLLIEIYSAYGRKISEIKWNHRNGRLLYLSWSHQEQLLCVSNLGDIYAYDLFATLQKTFSVDNDKRKIVDCRVCVRKQDTFIVLVDETNVLYGIQDLSNPKVLHFPDPPRQAEFASGETCWEIYFDSCLSVVVIVEAEVFLIGSGSNACSQIRHLFKNQFTRINQISFDYNFKKVCLFTNTGFLMLAKINEINITRLCEFETKSLVIPSQLIWPGDQAICAIWKNILLFVGLDNDWFSHVLEDKQEFCLVSELDGVRVLGNMSHDFIERIPEVVISVFKIGSEAPGALLLEAHKEFQRKTHLANEYVRILSEKSQHEAAVRQCVEAAMFEFKISHQKMLLRAAAYGKCFIPDSSTTTALFTSMCQQLRVLNAVRRVETAIPLTYRQYDELRISHLIDRLIARRDYVLAVQISCYLCLDRQSGIVRILRDWAHYKVKQFEYADALVADQIARKIAEHHEISFSDIANQAVEFNRKELAIQLIEHDCRPGDQVPLLLKLQRRDEALLKAIESGDSNLVYSVILSPQFRQNSPGIYFKLLKRFPVAYRLYIRYLKCGDRLALKEFYHMDGNHSDQAITYVKEAYEKFDDRLELRQIPLTSALECFRKGKHDFAANATEEQIKLNKYQQKLEEKFKPQKYGGLSLQETMKQLVVDKMFKLADDLKKEYRVSDKRFWWLKIGTLAEGGEWFELEKFGNQKKSPIGYEVSGGGKSIRELFRILKKQRVNACIFPTRFDLEACAPFFSLF